MKIQLAYEKKYPYLAINTFGESLKNDLTKYGSDEIMLISKIPGKERSEAEQIHVQYVNGHREGWVTKNESDYQALPAGFEITFKQ